MTQDLPSMTDYRETIERGSACFSDEELRAGKKPTAAETGSDTVFYAFGYPGDSGVVYMVKCPERRIFGAKCFVLRRPSTDHYQAIEEYLKRENIPAFPELLSYSAGGIAVRGTSYPLVKMKWIEGVRLDKHIESCLPDPSKLIALAKTWTELSQDLRARGIAHGNLECSNVLVERGRLRLVDCDTMYIPELEGANCPEIGNRNYQHPGRKAFHFGPFVDNFSDWIIYISIVALSIDNSLWRYAKIGQQLLFQKSDLEQPDRSDLIAILKSHQDPRIREISEILMSHLQCNFDEVPNLDPEHCARLLQPSA